MLCSHNLIFCVYFLFVVLISENQLRLLCLACIFGNLVKELQLEEQFRGGPLIHYRSDILDREVGKWREEEEGKGS